MTGNDKIRLIVMVDISNRDRPRAGRAKWIADRPSETTIALTEMNTDAVGAIVGNS